MADAAVLGSSDKVALDDAVFGAPFNGPLVHEAVVAELAARRRGTHATLTRGKVSGGGAKPWRQKGTGRARAGSSRSPLWIGGGTVFGPSPRHYTVKVNRKARRAALRAALSVHAERGSLFVVDAGAFDAPSTRQAHGLVAERLGGSVLVALAPEGEDAAAKSFRNLAGVSVLPADAVGVADVVGAATLVVSRDALDHISTLAARPVNHATLEPSAANEAATADTSASADTSAADEAAAADASAADEAATADASAADEEEAS
jgi:large subunit ribosomal protein L4